MVKPLNKEWELFGRRYRVAGAKGDKVDCKACHKQVSASVNRLQSHLRVCPASDVGESSGATLSDTIPTASELAEHALEADAVATEQPQASAAIPAENDARSAKKQRQTPARTRDRRWNTTPANALNVDDLWLSSIVGGPAMTSSPAQPTATSAFNKRRLDIEEKRLELEMKRDERDERRERLNLEILEAQAKKEKLLVKKQEYENNVLLALSRKQLREQGVSEDEIDRLMPIPTSPGSVAAGSEKDVTTETEASELQVADRVDDEML